jgi:hypothetical protein
MEHYLGFNLGKIFEELGNNFGDGRDLAFMRMTIYLTEIWEQNTEISEKLDEKNHDIIGRVLKCHLKTEYYLNKIIEDLGNSFIPREIREGMYFGKIEKLKEVFVNDTAFLNLAEVLIEVNKIRNKYAHTINFKIKPENIPNF